MALTEASVDRSVFLAGQQIISKPGQDTTSGECQRRELLEAARVTIRRPRGLRNCSDSHCVCGTASGKSFEEVKANVEEVKLSVAKSTAKVDGFDARLTAAAASEKAAETTQAAILAIANF